MAWSQISSDWKQSTSSCLAVLLSNLGFFQITEKLLQFQKLEIKLAPYINTPVGEK